MTAFLSPQRLARVAVRHPWLVVSIWVLLLVGGAAAATTIGGVLTSEQKVYVDRDAFAADKIIEDHFPSAVPEFEYVIVQSQAATADSAGYRAFVEAMVADLRGQTAAVATATPFYDAPDPASLVSADGRTVLIPVVLAGKPETSVATLMKRVATFDGKDGFSVVVAGPASIDRTWLQASEKDLQAAEVFGLPVALVILAVVFGALVAAGLPLALGFLSIVVATGVTAILGQFFELSTFVLNMITMIGLAVGIDYSLLVVQRFREERGHGAGRDDAIIHAAATASRSVLFSGIAVVIALSGLLLVPDNIFRSLGAGAIVVVIVAVAAALTLLPAVLRLLGDRVNAARVRIPFRSSGQGRFWVVATNFVTRHAVVSVVASVGLLVAAAAPYLAIELGSAGVASLPAGTGVRQGFEILDREFNAGVLAPADIVIESSDVHAEPIRAGVIRLEGMLLSDAAFGQVSVQVSADGTVTRVSAPIQGDPQGDEAAAALSRLRDDYIPEAFANVDARVLVTGSTAIGQDYSGIIDTYTPIVFAFVLGFSFLILMVVFRSIVVPIKAIAMNLLSVGAAYGLMVTVFQHGFGADFLGFQQSERIESWVPLFMFATLFGLSMDYHVFLLSRIRERFDQTGDNAASVVHGVQSTAGMITGAALIMVAVFGGFAMGDLVAFQQMGFGLAVAVFLDATVVRSVLVPASMTLLGDWNWYLPSWLTWLPRVQVEGHGLVEGSGLTEVAAGA
ncbi:MAG: MMPL family transporter [Chloroflexi bacterium]|nr:MMPL family transporter [Chloroflexota bacterium]